VGDASYQGQSEAIHEAALRAQDMTNPRAKNGKGEVDEIEKRKGSSE
jgi:hypothetical protein